ncbi:hypothetical protein [Fluviispira multicolorata]|uniref:Uncharacterized protein n=1 Tax=Fluviispira multicolorata TaxID=2654512 RepID=A0A833JD20_9BACT|nr:hypothetical protein [Fluviispira multicolorata]KAB8028007.1 hypothetical protein GCL57_13205 [Fluviispira multicolorata]
MIKILNSNYIKVSFVFVMMLLILGIPVNLFSSFLIITIFFFLFYLIDFKIDSRKFLKLFFIFVIVKILQSFIPQIEIQEGHKPFLISNQSKEDEYLYLPIEFREKMRSDFFKLYPKESWCKKDSWGCWSFSNILNESYSFSSDNLLKNAKYSRVVDGFNYSNLEQFHLSINNLHYNWYSQEPKNIKRNSIPFYVFYEFDSNSIGSKICYNGKMNLYSEVKNKLIDNSHNESSAQCVKITDEYIGKKIWLGVFQDAGEYRIWFEKSNFALFYEFLFKFLSLIFLITLIYSIFNSKRYYFIFSIIISLLLFGSNQFTYFDIYPVYDGGSDSLTYESWGIDIAKYFKEGDFYNVFKGNESIYYYQPGMRYIKALFSYIFGARIFGSYLFFVAIMFSLYLILKELQFFKNRVSFISLALFLILFLRPIRDGLFASQYSYSIDGYSETAANTLLLFALLLNIRIFTKQKLNNQFVFYSSFLMCLSVFLRPNYIICFTIVQTFLFFHIIKHEKYKLILPYFIGNIFIFTFLFHNLYFGRKFVLFTSSVGIKENLIISPKEYLSEIYNILKFTPNKYEIYKIFEHLSRWLDYRFFNLICIFILLLSILNFRKFFPLNIRIIAISALGLHLPSLFYLNFDRYTALSWILTYIVYSFFLSNMLIYIYNTQIKRVSNQIKT